MGAGSQYIVANYPADLSQAEAGVNYLGHAGAGGVYFDLHDGVHEVCIQQAQRLVAAETSCSLEGFRTNIGPQIPAAYGHQKFVTVPAGSLLLVHYGALQRSSNGAGVSVAATSQRSRLLSADLWHRGSGNTSALNRHMSEPRTFTS